MIIPSYRKNPAVIRKIVFFCRMESRGISYQQDPFFRNKQKKLYASKSFPPEFSDKVDVSRVSLEAIRPWIERRVTQLLGDEDEIVNEYCIAQLEAYDPVERTIDPREVQINLEGFLGVDSAAILMRELWNLLLSAQLSSSGVPEELVEQKKREEEEKRGEAERVRIELEKKRKAERAEKDYEIMQRERERRTERRGSPSHRDRSPQYRNRRRSRSRSRERDYRSSRR
jgi:serine/arginine repetitive matrix protein 1